jgi:hypothetical protein
MAVMGGRGVKRLLEWECGRRREMMGREMGVGERLKKSVVMGWESEKTRMDGGE